jgi:hypothetical protein
MSAAFGLCLERRQLVFGIGLDAQMVDAGLAAPGRNGEVDAWVLEHPLGIVALDAGGLRGEHPRIEGDGRLQVLDVGVNMETLHGSLLGGDGFQHLHEAGDDPTAHAAPWQQFSVR